MGRDKSGHGKNPTEEGHLPTGDGVERDKSGHRKNPTERGVPVLTSWRRHQEGQVRTRKEFNRATDTYQLKTAPGGTTQNTERIQLSEGHSHPGDVIGRDKSDTARFRPSEGHSQTGDSIGRENMERIQSGKRHSLPGDGIRRDKSKHGKNPTERGALTSWRRHREGQVRTWKKSD